jgi:hypothetical protein
MANTSTDVVKGVCYSTQIQPQSVAVDVIRNGDVVGWTNRNVASDGSFRIYFGGKAGFGYQPVKTSEGDRVSVACRYNTGDVVRLLFTVS